MIKSAKLEISFNPLMFVSLSVNKERSTAF